MVLSPKIFDDIDDDGTVFEHDPPVRLSSGNQLGGFRHTGFWNAMDTLRDKRHLENSWVSGAAAWRTW